MLGSEDLLNRLSIKINMIQQLLIKKGTSLQPQQQQKQSKHDSQQQLLPNQQPRLSFRHKVYYSRVSYKTMGQWVKAHLSFDRFCLFTNLILPWPGSIKINISFHPGGIPPGITTSSGGCQVINWHSSCSQKAKGLSNF